MAMTKKERAEVDDLVSRLRHVAALRWTEPVMRDVPPPDKNLSGMRFTSGWDFNSYLCVVDKGWSSTIGHGRGEPPVAQRYSGGSQNAKSYFSTRLLALKAMRHAVENEAAKKLATIDEMIEQESKGERK